MELTRDPLRALLHVTGECCKVFCSSFHTLVSHHTPIEKCDEIRERRVLLSSMFSSLAAMR